MQCFIYRSSVKEGLYVYLAEQDGLKELPEPVLKQLGEPELTMTLDLQPERKLSQEDTRVVLENLKTRGFHLQMPRDIEHQLAAVAKNVSG